MMHEVVDHDVHDGDEWRTGRGVSAVPDRTNIDDWCVRVGLPQAMIAELIGYRDRMVACEAVSTLFHAFCDRLSLQTDWPDPTADEAVLRVCGDDAWRFGLIAYLSMLPRAEAWYRAHGIGSDLFNATMADIGLWGANNTARHRAVRFTEFSWIHMHLSCRLFRLGRLQFALLPYHGEALFLRHRSEHRIVVLAVSGIRIRSDGYVDGTDHHTDPYAWTTTLATTASGWLGHPVSPDGRTQKEEVAFTASDWEVALQPGDDTLDVHIPQGSPLDIEATMASFGQALPFFRQVFPQHAPQAFHCHSWLLAPQFGQMLPESSNIVRFGHLFHRYPSEGDRQEAWERVFGHHALSLREAPRDSSLQRALYDWLSEGRLLFSMAGMRFV